MLHLVKYRPHRRGCEASRKPGYTVLMSRRRLLRVAFCALILVWLPLSVAAAEIITSNNPVAVISGEPQEERLVDLEVISTPSGAELSLNGRPRGVTPVRLTNLPPGLSVVEVAAPGYETTRLRLRLQSNESAVLSVPLRRETGLLRLDVEPSDAEAFLSGEPLSTGEPVELPTGTHLLRVRRFGYREEEVPVVVEARETLYLQLALEAAPFAIDLRQIGGSSRLVLTATAPGSAIATIRNPDGTQAIRRPLALDSPATPVLSAGELPPGKYRVTVTAEAASGTTAVVLSRDLTVGEAGPVSGLLYAPLPASVSSGNPTIGSGWAYVPDADDTGSPASGFSLSASLGVRENVAVYLGATALLFETPERNRLGFSLAGLWRFWETDDAALGLGGRATVDAPVGSERSYRPDYFGTPEGLFLHLPGSVDLGPITLTAAPEAGFSWRAAGWRTDGEDSIDPLAIIGTRAGVHGTVGFLVLGLSGRIAWGLPRQENDRGPTAQLGAETRLVVPRWAASISPFFALAGPYDDMRALVGFWVMVGDR